MEALKEELDRRGPAMLQSHLPALAGEWAEPLCKLAGGALGKAYFGSSGSAGVEAAIKFARATTGRAQIVYAPEQFPRVDCRALSLMNDAFWREGFEKHPDADLRKQLYGAEGGTAVGGDRRAAE